MTSTTQERSALRQVAREIFMHALKQISVETAFDKHVEYSRGVLRICDDLYHLNSYHRVLAISLGKAGHTMAAALAKRLGTLVSGIVAVPEDALRGQSHVAGFRLPASLFHCSPNPL